MKPASSQSFNDTQKATHRLFGIRQSLSETQLALLQKRSVLTGC